LALCTESRGSAMPAILPECCSGSISYENPREGKMATGVVKLY